MVEGKREPRDLLPPTLAVLHILLALAKGERYGYGIMQEVERRTGGRYGWVLGRSTVR
jgi:DNA-binding PadR family transcriptional regulator